MEEKLQELAEADGNPEMHQAPDSLDQLLQRELKLAGKKRELVEKVAEGVFLINGRVCQVRREKKKDLTVTYVKVGDSEDSVPVQDTMPIKRFLAVHCSEAA